ncbi:class I SAM-dependent methyltransferase [Roseomonas sp. NAR14]|uniref:Class I SAM-dependent methyltransferase n=1 Tax=Roseomonas acroporae TaxID=2937791 RepID=A0A9X2BT48_9PROT|nr:class I SAM-dependent methyltransferase [Roseomonas acroporae]MCK8783867.1 class I SAM-dependent methyltransferase [Roseomonas acroporae]
MTKLHADGGQPDLPDATLAALTEPSLDPLFWRAERLGEPSAWWLHVPFAHWLVASARPGVLVELGTHAGVSYAAFCHAVRSAGLATRCHAVDTWRGDPQAGEYDESVFNNLLAYNNEHFAAFSTLIRGTFDDALDRIEDASIDLLHIDGLHTYEAVRHDFESWLPKLSPRATVLFHDINERSGDFGVWRLWEELRGRHPSFAFLHGHGLGVLAVGEQSPAAVLDLCGITEPHRLAAVRGRFARLGERWLTDTRERMLGQRHGMLAAEADALRAQLAGEQAAHANTAARLAAEQAEHAGTRERLAAEQAGHAGTQARFAEAEASQARLAEENAALRDWRDGAEARAAEQRQAEARMRDLAAQRAAAARQKALAAQEETTRVREEARLVEEAARQLRDEVAHLRGEIAAAAARAREAQARIAELVADRDAHKSTHEQLVASTFWRATWPLRNAAGRVPQPLRRAVRGGAKLAWWTTTMRLPAKLEERRARIAQFAAAAAAMPPGLPPGAVAPQPPPIALPRTDAPGAALRLVYVSGEPDTPGHLYRIERYARAAAALGATTRILRVDEIPDRLGEIEAATALIVWRAPWSDQIEAAIGAARRGGARVVFDVDDLMIDPALAQVDIIDGIRSQHLTEEMVRSHYANVRRTMEAADLCFTTTEELAFHLRWAGKTTHVLPNGFDQATFDLSRRAMREWRRDRTDRLIRIGYAGGSRTHQRDFAMAVEGLARLLRENADCRLVLFRTADGLTPLVDIEEFPALAGLEERIEWRSVQPLARLPVEMARFDINLAPLEYGNPFCEAKSELKFFEAALAGVPTVASPTGPFRRAMEHGRTGYLAASADDWYDALRRLAGDPALRGRMAAAACHTALERFGPLSRATQMGRVLAQLQGGPAGASAFALEAQLAGRPVAPPRLFGADTVFEHDMGGDAELTVIIPLHNYEGYIEEALQSVHDQTLGALDLVVVDDRSTDDSLEVARRWVERHALRFNRAVVLSHRVNRGLAYSRNTGFDTARTPYVLPLDADNRLLPSCCETLLRTLRGSGAAYAYPTIQHFGASSALISNAPYDPKRFVAGNYIDAMALIAKEAWAMVGGYDHVRFGWEDFDFWCRLAERGLSGTWQQEVLAQYRVHAASMLKTQTTVEDNYRTLIADFAVRHPWVSLIDQQRLRRMPLSTPHLTPPAERTRLDALLPILRCPESGERLAWNADRTALHSVDGAHVWPVKAGRPVLAPHLADPVVHPDSHVSNEVPEEALALIRETPGLVLNLSAGGSLERHPNVVEVEYAIFRHTDIVSDAHVLPFYDDTFEAVVVMNAFEHYREPHRVAAELLRVLRPGGRILIRTAFMQPLHERPWHFFNCTRYGLAEWFKGFETETLHVSRNFCPNHSIAWLASEAEAALRGDVSAASAEAFAAAPVGRLVEMWRDPSRRDQPLWTDFERLSQTTQEITAAGFEFLGRKPLDPAAGA